jgi:hypothetical protein
MATMTSWIPSNHMTSVIQQFCVNQSLGFSLFCNCSERFIGASVLFVKFREQGVNPNPSEAIINVKVIVYDSPQMIITGVSVLTPSRPGLTYE